MKVRFDDLNLPEDMSSLYKSKDYYISLERDNDISYEDKYWGHIIDPDGVKRTRDTDTERKQYLADNQCELSYISKLLPGRVLDIGCGLGWILSVISDEWEKYGVELSKFASDKANNHAQILTGAFTENNFIDNWFDLIIMSHVIEHIEDPVDNIKEVSRILKKRGSLILATPDFDSGCARLFGNNYRLLNDSTHISLFSNDSMHRFLRDNGFNILKVDYPYFNTRHFNEDNLLRLFDNKSISPAFYGNFMTFYCVKE